MHATGTIQVIDPVGRQANRARLAQDGPYVRRRARKIAPHLRLHGLSIDFEHTGGKRTIVLKSQGLDEEEDDLICGQRSGVVIGGFGFGQSFVGTRTARKGRVR